MSTDEKTDRYRELFERSADAILIIVGGKFVDCNASTVKMLRYKNKQALLNTHPSQLSPEYQSDGRLSYEKANEMIEVAFEKGSHRFEWDHIRADNEVFPVEVLLTAVKEDNQNALHVVWREISDRKTAEREKLQLINELQKALDEVNTLRGIIPICASCKKIRDDGGLWNKIEAYIQDRSEVEFSHCVCPDCAKKLYPDLVDENGNIQET